jgi:hypothetical protein
LFQIKKIEVIFFKILKLEEVGRVDEEKKEKYSELQSNRIACQQQMN